MAPIRLTVSALYGSGCSKVPWLFFYVYMYWLINGNPFLSVLHHDFIHAKLSISSSCVCMCKQHLCVGVQDTGSESHGWQAAFHRGAGDSDHREFDSHLHWPGEIAAAQQEHWAPQSQQGGTAQILCSSRFYCWCWQLHLLPSENQRRTVGVVWKLLQSCEEPSFEFNFSTIIQPWLPHLN